MRKSVTLKMEDEYLQEILTSERKSLNRVLQTRHCVSAMSHGRVSLAEKLSPGQITYLKLNKLFALDDDYESSSFGEYIKWLLHHQGTKFFTFFVVMVNAVVTAMEGHHKVVAKDPYYTGGSFVFLSKIEYACIGFYTAEMCLELFVNRKSYFSSYFHRFDFGLLIITYMDLFDSNGSFNMGGGFHIIRSITYLRVLTAIPLFRGLQVTADAVKQTIFHSMIYVVLLLVMAIFIFAVMGHFLFISVEISQNITAIEHGWQQKLVDDWGSIWLAMGTLTAYITASDWVEVQKTLDHVSIYSRLFSILVIFVGNFVFSNIIIATIIINIEEAAAKEQIKKLEERLETTMRKREDAEHQMYLEMSRFKTTSGSDLKKTQSENFREWAETIQHKIAKPGDLINLTGMHGNVYWMHLYFQCLNRMDTQTFALRGFHLEMADTLIGLLDGKTANPRRASCTSGATPPSSIKTDSQRMSMTMKTTSGHHLRVSGGFRSAFKATPVFGMTSQLRKRVTLQSPEKEEF